MEYSKKILNTKISNIFDKKNIFTLTTGDPVVHITHGVGRYLGLVTLKINNEESDFILLEYADDEKLYVPVTSFNLITKYICINNATVQLNRLGSEIWKKNKVKIADQIRDFAAELLDIYARRALNKGFPFKYPKDYITFSSNCPFTETNDQKSAIKSVIYDMTSDKQMDRLICGDVGFGKTEVAMRAAFIAIKNNKQVAILVPTTLLAQQHYNSFCYRFQSWQVNIELISRFNKIKETEDISIRLAKGEIDILIGTHKLLQKNIKFYNLGLVIVDEEHRFGVLQKEQLKVIKPDVDILTLTATPIPRTLNMAILGIRDISIINTPPEKRLSVRTFVQEKTNSLIQLAIKRELLRGGQVYYLYNEVNTIEKCAIDIRTLVPEAVICICHGQMNERELKNLMSDFYSKKFNVLVASSIIETGIDIKNANTIIIERADKFGLAQLHQLRGRVGRSDKQAYAYLLTPSKTKITIDAKKRLDAIINAQKLGSGVALATQDLEIRGVGEILGNIQSGQIKTIGLSLYLEILNKAIKYINTKDYKDTINISHSILSLPTEINLQVPVIIPQNYINDVNTRLILYKRIASAVNEDSLKKIQIELISQFGLLPEKVKILLELAFLKLKAEKLGIIKIDIYGNNCRIEFYSNSIIDTKLLVKVIQKQPTLYKLEKNILTFKMSISDYQDKINYINSLINNFL